MYEQDPVTDVLRKVELWFLFKCMFFYRNIELKNSNRLLSYFLFQAIAKVAQSFMFLFMWDTTHGDNLKGANKVDTRRPSLKMFCLKETKDEMKAA